MRTLKRQVLGMAAISAVLLLLAGCGGGGDDDGEGPPANRSPRANAGPDQIVDAGSTVTLDGSGSSDSDGTIASYQWTQTPETTVSLSNANEASASFTAPQVDMAVTLTFRLTVTDDDGATDPDTVSVTVQPVTVTMPTETVSLSGTVIDHFTGNAIPGATVTVYQESAAMPLGTTRTDATGAYQISISADPGRVTVKTEHGGFAPQSVVVDLEEGTSAASADLGNVPVGVSGVFDPMQPIEVMGDGGEMLVSVPANSLVTASGANPAGMVSADVTVLNPSDPTVMPGDFMARNAEGELQPIDSFGAMDVRFEDDSGESLTLSSGQQARIRIPLASNKEPADAPARMPMFYWSDEMGHWIQEGTATLDRAAGVYVGDVGHFTVWNVDAWVDTIDVSVCVEDSAGDPVIGAWVYAQGAVNFNGWSAGRTDPPNGSLDLPVAQHTHIVLSVLYASPSASPRSALVSQVFRTGSSDMTRPSCLVVPDPGDFVLDTSRLDNPNSQL